MLSEGLTFLVRYGKIFSVNRHKVILRCLEGRGIRGYIDDFSPSDDRVTVEDESSARQEIGVEELKAIFFVRTFEGNKRHAENKSFLDQVPPDKGIFMKFKDGECMTRYLEGSVLWNRGFFLEPKERTRVFPSSRR